MAVKSEQAHGWGIKLTALAVSFVFTVTSVTWTTPASAAPADVPVSSVLSIETLAIPPEMGTITETSFPLKDQRQQTTDQRLESQNTSQQSDGEKSLQSSVSSLQSSAGADRLVILIQDAHAVIDAQKNIARILMHLQKKFGIELTALEGAKERLEPIVLRTFPEPEVRRRILAGYEQRAELSGPEMAAVFQEQAGEFRGMEDWKLYEKNYAAYREAQAQKDPLMTQWNVFKQSLDAERSKVYSPALSEFEEIRENYLFERASLLDLLIYLSQFSDLLKKSAGYQELPGLIASIRYERSGKQEALVPLVRKIADEFKSKYLRGLGVKYEMNFYNRYQAFVTGQITAGEMLQYLVKLGSESGKKIKLTPALKRLLGHTQLLSEIRGSQLYEELARFLAEVESTLLKTPAERDLADRYRRLFLLKDLISLELMHEAYAAYQKEPETYLSLFPDPAFRKDLAPAVAYYQAALERDQAFFKNIMSMITKERSGAPNSGLRTAAVVAGGFHTQGLERAFRENGVAYAVVAPKIDSLTGSENYAKVMKGDLSFKESLKTTYYDALMRDAGRRLIDALPIQERVRTLKAWRDNLIRELAKDGRLAEAGKFLPYIDELLHRMPDAVTAISAKRSKEEILGLVDQELVTFKKDSLERIWKTFEHQLGVFVDGLKGLVAKKEVTAQSVSALLETASQAKPSHLALLQALDPSIPVVEHPVMHEATPGVVVGAERMASPVVASSTPEASTSIPIQRSEVRIGAKVQTLIMAGILALSIAWTSVASVDSAFAGTMGAGAKGTARVEAMVSVTSIPMYKEAARFLRQGINTGAVIDTGEKKEVKLSLEGEKETMKRVMDHARRIIKEVWTEYSDAEQEALLKIFMIIAHIESGGFDQVVQKVKRGKELKPILIATGYGQVELKTVEEILFHYFFLPSGSKHHKAEKLFVAKSLRLYSKKLSAEENIAVLMKFLRAMKVAAGNDKQMLHAALARVMFDDDLGNFMSLLSIRRIKMRTGEEILFSELIEEIQEFYNDYSGHRYLDGRVERAVKAVEKFYAEMSISTQQSPEGKTPRDAGVPVQETPTVAGVPTQASEAVAKIPEAVPANEKVVLKAQKKKEFEPGPTPTQEVAPATAKVETPASSTKTGFSGIGLFLAVALIGGAIVLWIELSTKRRRASAKSNYVTNAIRGLQRAISHKGFRDIEHQKVSPRERRQEVRPAPDVKRRSEIRDGGRDPSVGGALRQGMMIAVLTLGLSGAVHVYDSVTSLAMSATDEPSELMAVSSEKRVAEVTESLTRKGITSRMVVAQAQSIEKEFQELGPEKTREMVSQELVRIIRDVRSGLSTQEQDALHNILMHLFMIESEFRYVIQRNSKNKPAFIGGVGFGQVGYRTMVNILLNYLTREAPEGDPDQAVLQKEQDFVAGCFGLSSSEELMELLRDLKAFYKKPQNKPVLHRNLVHYLMRSGHSSKAFSLFQFVAMVKLLQGVPPNESLSDYVYEPDGSFEHPSNRNLADLYAGHYIGNIDKKYLAFRNLQKNYESVIPILKDTRESMPVADEDAGEEVADEEMIGEETVEEEVAPMLVEVGPGVVYEPAEPVQTVSASSWMTLGGAALILGLFFVGLRIGIWRALFGKSQVPPQGQESSQPEVGSEDRRSEMRAGDTAVGSGRELIELFPSNVRAEAMQLISKTERIMLLIEQRLQKGEGKEAGELILDLLKSRVMTRGPMTVAKIDEWFQLLRGMGRESKEVASTLLTEAVKSGLLERTKIEKYLQLLADLEWHENAGLLLIQAVKSGLMERARINEYLEALKEMGREELAGRLLFDALMSQVMERNVASAAMIDEYVQVQQKAKKSYGGFITAAVRAGYLKREPKSTDKIHEWFQMLLNATGNEFAASELIIEAVKSGYVKRDAAAIAKIDECLQTALAKGWGVMIGPIVIKAVEPGFLEPNAASVDKIHKWFQMLMESKGEIYAGRFIVEAAKSGLIVRSPEAVAKINEWLESVQGKVNYHNFGRQIIEAVQSGLMERTKIDKYFQLFRENGLDSLAGLLLIEAVKSGLMERSEASIAQIDQCIQSLLRKKDYADAGQLLVEAVKPGLVNRNAGVIEKLDECFRSLIDQKKELIASKLVGEVVTSGVVEKDAAWIAQVDAWSQVLMNHGMEVSVANIWISESSGALSLLNRFMSAERLENAQGRVHSWIKAHNFDQSVTNPVLGEIVFGQDTAWIENLDQERDELLSLINRRNDELAQNRRLTGDEISQILSMAVAVEFLVPGSLKNLTNLIESQQTFSARMPRKWTAEKKAVLESPGLAQVFRNYQRRLEFESGRRKYSPDVTGLLQLMNLVSLYVVMGHAREAVEALSPAEGKALSPAQLAKNMKRQMLMFLARDLEIKTDISDSVFGLLDWKRVHLLVQGLETIKLRSSSENVDLMRALLTAFFQGRFKDFIENPDQTDAMGRRLALHNKRVRDLGQQKGDDMDAWLGKNSRVEPRELLYSGQGQDRTWNPDADVKQILEDAGKACVAAREASVDWMKILESAGLKSSESEGGVQFEVIQKGSKKMDAVGILTDLKLLGENGDPATLLGAVQSLVIKLRELQDVQALEAVNHFYEKLTILKTRLLAPENRETLGMRNYFRFKLYDRQPGRDLFIGDKVTCCLGMGSRQFPHAMADRLVDEGMSVMEVVDEKTGETMAAAWLYLAEDGSLVVQNLEINAAYERSQALMFWIGEQMIDYADYVRRQISVKDLYLGMAGHGKYISNSDFIKEVVTGKFGGRKVTFAKQKLGGTWGTEPYYLDSAGKPEAYLIPSRSEVRDAGKIVNARGESFDVVYERANMDAVGRLQDPRDWRKHEQDEVRAAYAESLSNMSLDELGHELHRLFSYQIPEVGSMIPLNDPALLELKGESFLQGFADHLTAGGQLDHYIGYANIPKMFRASLQDRPDWSDIQLEWDKFAVALREVALRWSEKKPAKGRKAPSAKPAPRKAGVRIEIPQGVPALASDRRLGEVFDSKQLGMDAGLLAKRLYQLSTLCYSQKEQKGMSVEEWQDILNDPYQSVLILRDLSGDIVGAAVGGSPFTLEGKKGVWLNRLMSRDDDVLGKGGFLLDAFLSRRFNEGVEIFRWNTSRFSEDFYLNEFNEEKGYLKPRQDAGMLERLKHDRSRSVTPEADIEIRVKVNPLDPRFDFLKNFWGLRRSEVRFKIPEGVKAIAPDIGVGEVVDARAVLRADRSLIKPLAQFLYALEVKLFSWENKAGGVREWEDALKHRSQHVHLLVKEKNIVGATLSISPLPHVGGARLVEIMIDKDGTRGKGTYLLDVFLSEMYKKNIENIEWYSLGDGKIFYPPFLEERQANRVLDFEKEGNSYKITLLKDPLAPEFVELRSFVGQPRSEVRFKIPEGVKVIAPDIGVGEVVDAKDVLRADPAQLKPLAKFLHAFEEKHFPWLEKDDGERYWEDALKYPSQHVHLLVRDKHVVGATLSFTDFPERGEALLSEIMSDKDGIPGKATYLMDVFLSEMSKKGIEKIEFSVVREGIAFFRSYLNDRASKGVISFEPEGDHHYIIHLPKDRTVSKFDDLREFVGSKRSEARFTIPKGVPVIETHDILGKVVDARELLEVDPDRMKPLAESLKDPKQHVYLLINPSGDVTGAVIFRYLSAKGQKEVWMDRIVSLDDGIRGKGSFLMYSFLRSMQMGGTEIVGWQSNGGAFNFYQHFLKPWHDKGTLLFEDGGGQFRVRFLKKEMQPDTEFESFWGGRDSGVSSDIPKVAVVAEYKGLGKMVDAREWLKLAPDQLTPLAARLSYLDRPSFDLGKWDMDTGFWEAMLEDSDQALWVFVDSNGEVSGAVVPRGSEMTGIKKLWLDSFLSLDGQALAPLMDLFLDLMNKEGVESIRWYSSDDRELDLLKARQEKGLLTFKREGRSYDVNLPKNPLGESGETRRSEVRFEIPERAVINNDHPGIGIVVDVKMLGLNKSQLDLLAEDYFDLEAKAFPGKEPDRNAWNATFEDDNFNIRLYMVLNASKEVLAAVRVHFIMGYKFAVLETFMSREDGVQGKGTLLLDAVLGEIRDRGVTDVRLAFNAKSKAFYVDEEKGYLTVRQNAGALTFIPYDGNNNDGLIKILLGQDLMDKKFDGLRSFVSQHAEEGLGPVAVGMSQLPAAATPERSEVRSPAIISHDALGTVVDARKWLEENPGQLKSLAKRLFNLEVSRGFTTKDRREGVLEWEEEFQDPNSFVYVLMKPQPLGSIGGVVVANSSPFEGRKGARVTRLVSAKDKILGNGTITFDAALSDMFRKDMKHITLRFPYDSRRFYLEFLEPRVEAGMLTVKPSIHELKNNPSIHEFRIDLSEEDPLDPKFNSLRSFFGSRRSGMWVDQYPLVALTGTTGDQIVELAQKSDPDVVRSELRKRGQAELEKKIEAGIEQFRKELGRYETAREIVSFIISSEFQDRLTALLGEFGDVAELVSRIRNRVVFGDEHLSSERLADNASELDLGRVAMDQAHLDAAAVGLLMNAKEPSFVLLMDRPADAIAEEVLAMLATLKPSELIIYNEAKEKPFGRAWQNKLKVPIMPVGNTNAVRRAVKASNDLVVSFWTKDRKIDDLGIYSVLAEIGRIADPRLRELALTAVRVALLRFASLEEPIQAEILKDPAKIQSYLEQFGIPKFVQFNAKGLVFSIERLVEEYTAKRSVEQAA